MLFVGAIHRQVIIVVELKPVTRGGCLTVREVAVVTVTNFVVLVRTEQPTHKTPLPHHGETLRLCFKPVREPFLIGASVERGGGGEFDGFELRVGGFGDHGEAVGFFFGLWAGAVVGMTVVVVVGVVSGRAGDDALVRCQAVCDALMCGLLFSR